MSMYLIIIDPIYKLLGLRDENKAGDIASLLNEIEALAVETGAAVAFGAHYSKGNQAGKEVIDRIGGSGVFARDPDSILNFTKHEENDCFTVDATLRNHPPIKPFVVRWEYPLMCADATLNPSELKQPGRPEFIAQKTCCSSRQTDGRQRIQEDGQRIRNGAPACLRTTG